MAVVIGGLGSLAGAVWGAVLLVALPDLTHSRDRAARRCRRALAQRLEGNLPLAVFGLTLIVVMIAAPGGVQGAARGSAGRCRRWRARRRPEQRPADRTPHRSAPTNRDRRRGRCPRCIARHGAVSRIATAIAAARPPPRPAATDDTGAGGGAACPASPTPRSWSARTCR